MASFSLPAISEYILHYQRIYSKKMRGFASIVVVLLVALFCVAGPLRAQNVPAIGSVERAIRAGDASGIAHYFGNTVDITINNNQATYNRTQGELVLRDFFGRNTVSGFQVDHTGAASSSNSVFSVGSLNTSTGKYRVYFLLRQKDGGYTLTEIRFQR